MLLCTMSEELLVAEMTRLMTSVQPINIPCVAVNELLRFGTTRSPMSATSQTGSKKGETYSSTKMVKPSS